MKKFFEWESNMNTTTDIFLERADELLFESMRQMGIESEVSKTTLAQQFNRYMQNLLEYNAHTNLTAITEPEEVYIKHFVDSISAIVALKYLNDEKYEQKTFIDVGTGAGFPSVPVKIVLPNIRLTLLDSLEKRTRFLKQLTNDLNLQNVTILHQRAEDAARQKDKRESYDFVLSRAVANLPVLLEYCLPFLKKNGYMICLKGPSIDEEIQKSKKALKILGAELIDILDIQIPFSDFNHKIAIIKKVKNTDGKYPRKAGTPSKEPLM